jgi:hypothetical protein
VCICIGESEGANADDMDDGDAVEEEKTEGGGGSLQKEAEEGLIRMGDKGSEFGNVQTRTQQQQHAHQRQPTTLFNSSFGSLIGVVNVMFGWCWVKTTAPDKSLLGWWLFDCSPQSLYVFPLSPSPQQSVHHTRTYTRTHTHTRQTHAHCAHKARHTRVFCGVCLHR